MGGLQASPRVDFAIPQGQESALSETGTFLRLVGLIQPLETGRAYPLTAKFRSASRKVVIEQVATKVRVNGVHCKLSSVTLPV